MAEPDSEGRPLPPQATMGLLNYITAHSLDEDYAHVHASGHTRAAPSSSQRLGRHLATLVVLALFGALVTTAGVRTSRSEPVRESSRASLVAQAQHRRQELDHARDRVASLRAAIEAGQRALLAASSSGRRLRSQLVQLGVAAGGEPASGPGVRITVDDNDEALTNRQVVLDTDLQRLVNGLWVSGAEAVAVNEERLTSLSSIRIAGDAITVNLRSMDRPYVVTAIGDPDDLAARFVESEGGTWWLNLKAVYNLQFTMTSEDSLTVPAAPTFRLRHARPATETR